MKTTIDIADGLLKEARKVIDREKITLRQLVELGLRHVLTEKRKRQPFHLRLVTVSGGGLRQGIPDTLPRELAYEWPEGSSK